MHDRTKLFLALGLITASITACGGDEATPADSIGGTDTDTDPSAGSNPSTTTPGEGTADTTAGDASTTDAETDGPTTGGEECVGEDGCWGCVPTTPTQVINRCTDASCEPFANDRRLPLLEPDGSLPPLP